MARTRLILSVVHARGVRVAGSIGGVDRRGHPRDAAEAGRDGDGAEPVVDPPLVDRGDDGGGGATGVDDQTDTPLRLVVQVEDRHSLGSVAEGHGPEVEAGADEVDLGLAGAFGGPGVVVREQAGLAGSVVVGEAPPPSGPGRWWDRDGR